MLIERSKENTKENIVKGVEDFLADNPTARYFFHSLYLTDINFNIEAAARATDIPLKQARQWAQELTQIGLLVKTESGHQIDPALEDQHFKYNAKSSFIAVNQALSLCSENGPCRYRFEVIKTNREVLERFEAGLINLFEVFRSESSELQKTDLLIDSNFTVVNVLKTLDLRSQIGSEGNEQ